MDTEGGGIEGYAGFLPAKTPPGDFHERPCDRDPGIV